MTTCPHWICLSVTLTANRLASQLLLPSVRMSHLRTLYTPVKQAKPAPPPPTPVAAKAEGVKFSPALADKLLPFVGSGAGLLQLEKRTELYARGGISVNDYWGTLNKVRFDGSWLV